MKMKRDEEGARLPLLLYKRLFLVYNELKSLKNMGSSKGLDTMGCMYNSLNDKEEQYEKE